MRSQDAARIVVALEVSIGPAAIVFLGCIFDPRTNRIRPPVVMSLQDQELGITHLSCCRYARASMKISVVA
jgi:hypothetical protein